MPGASAVGINGDKIPHTAYDCANKFNPLTVDQMMELVNRVKFEFNELIVLVGPAPSFVLTNRRLFYKSMKGYQNLSLDAIASAVDNVTSLTSTYVRYKTYDGSICDTIPAERMPLKDHINLALSLRDYIPRTSSK